MTKAEFNERAQRINQNVELPSPSEYRLIEFVYNYHPCIDNCRGKEQVAYLWCEFGLSIFEDMHPKAEKASILETKLVKAQHEVAVIQDALNELKTGQRSLDF